MVLRLLAAAGAAGVERALLSTDGMGVAGGVARALAKRRASEGRLPELEFVELDALTGTADDTRALVGAMRARGAAVIVALGGDGTVRAAAATCGDVPLLPLSTGTNNAFPEMWEATVAGTAAGPARHRARRRRRRRRTASRCCTSTRAARARDRAGRRLRLHRHPRRLEGAVAARDPARALLHLRRAARDRPVQHRRAAAPGRARTDPHGVAVTLGDPATAGATVSRPDRARGRRRRSACARPRALPAGDAAAASRVERGTVAVDGEREIEFGPGTPVTVTLAHDGPRVLDVRATLAAAAARRLLVRQPTRITHPAGGPMKAARFHGPGDIRIDDVPEPHRRAGAGEGRRRLVRHLRHRPARVPRRADLHPAEGLAAPAHRRGDAGGDGPRVRRRDLRGRRRRHAT